MLYLDERVKTICQELKMLALEQSEEITVWSYKKGLFYYPCEAENHEAEWQEFTRHMSWYGPDEHYWFRAMIHIPPVAAGHSARLMLETNVSGWDATNPQFLVFINHHIIQGADVNHTTIRLPDIYQTGTGASCLLDLQAFSGMEANTLTLTGRVVVVNEAVEGLYYDLITPLQAFTHRDGNDYTRQVLIAKLNQAINLLDLRKPYSPTFYESVAAARACLSEEVYGKFPASMPVLATCIGHTHIDIAWLWTVEQTKEKVARSFATVLNMMEEYPDFYFMSSQPQLYAFVKERYPELYHRLSEQIGKKRWEAEGGMWLEADCNLTSGESLVRQFLYGMRFFKDEFTVMNEVLWLPDCFGFSGVLPQIMKKCGISYFMTTKLSRNKENRLPHDTFLWRGIDGSEILTHMITAVDIGVGEGKQPVTAIVDMDIETGKQLTTYNGQLHPKALIGSWNHYQDKDLNHDILIAFGHGDGGGGPTREMLEMSARIQKGLPGIPGIRQAFTADYFKELDSRVRNDESNYDKHLAIWEGELYLERHRGTYTSMGRNKRSNRKAEFALMDLESFLVLAYGPDAMEDGRKQKLDNLWKLLLLNQFHDTLPGSAIKAVYDQTEEDYRVLLKGIDELTREAIDRICAVGVQDRPGPAQERSVTVQNRPESEQNRLESEQNRLESEQNRSGSVLTVFNMGGFRRGELVCLGRQTAKTLTDKYGAAYPIQQTDDLSYAYLPQLPSKGYQSFILQNCGMTPGSVMPHGMKQDGVMSNGVTPDGMTPDCAMADGVLSDGVLSDGVASNDMMQDNMTADGSTPVFVLDNEKTLTTPFYKVVFDENGLIDSLFDLENDREVIEPHGKANLLRLYEDKPADFDNWEIYPYYTEKYWDILDLTSFQWTAAGPVFAELSISRSFGDSLLNQKIRFYADSRRINFITVVDYYEKQQLLKVHFPVYIHTDTVTCDIQFGSITRPTHQNTSWDKARFESCAHKWVDLSEGHYGVSLLNDCKYGHSVQGNNIGLTLLKAGNFPNKEADRERHTFTYALYPHKGTLQEGNTVKEAYSLNQCLYVKQGVFFQSDYSLASVGPKNIILETIKKAEDENGYILRLYECENALTKAVLTWNQPFSKAYGCSLLEEIETELSLADGKIPLTFSPFEIKTVRLVY